MARPLRTLILVLVPLLCLAVTPPSAFADAPVDAPVWSLGQRWSYEGAVRGPGPVEDFTAIVTVVAISGEEARVRAAISYGFGTVVQDTLIALPTLQVLAFNASFPNGIRHRYEYEPPLEWFSFPLSAGKAWSSASNFTYSYWTHPLTRVSTPAGAFDAYPVEQDAMGIPMITVEFIVPGLGYAVLYYSAEVGQIVRYEAFNLWGALVAEFSLTEFSSLATPSRDAVDPTLSPAAGAVALLLAGACAASTMQFLRTIDLARHPRRRSTGAELTSPPASGRRSGKA